MHDVAWRCGKNCVRSKDALKQWTRTSLSVKILLISTHANWRRHRSIVIIFGLKMAWTKLIKKNSLLVLSRSRNWFIAELVRAEGARAEPHTSSCFVEVVVNCNCKQIVLCQFSPITSGLKTIIKKPICKYCQAEFYSFLWVSWHSCFVDC